MKRAFIMCILAAGLAFAAPSAAQQNQQAVAPQQAMDGKTAELAKKAQAGDADAQYQLGLAYAEGSGGLAKDPKKAVEWYTRAAMQGHADAQVELGSAYYNGTGVAPDMKQTALWYGAAAEQGQLAAMSNMAYLCQAGWGVPKDFVQAYMWYTLAMEAGDANAIAQRSRIAPLMTDKQIAEAQSRAKKWKPVKGKVPAGMQ